MNEEFASTQFVMTDQFTLDILLATYNGERYLEEQLQSLLNQTDQDWRLLVRDDESSDGTPKIIARFAAANPTRVFVLHDERGCLGVIGNFAALMAASTADYVMFCDQDDIWLPEKIVRSRVAMAALEAKHGGDRPLLVHGDLRLVDDSLREIQPSFFQYQMIDPIKGRALERLLVRNIAPGCAMLLNRKLCDLAIPVPNGVIMHDWWAILIAASLGAVGCVMEPLALYRQHATNTVGAKWRPMRETIPELIRIPVTIWRRNHQKFRKTQRQAETLEAAYGAQMQHDTRRIVRRYGRIGQRGFFARRIDLLRYGYSPNGSIIRNIELFFFS